MNYKCEKCGAEGVEKECTIGDWYKKKFIVFPCECYSFNADKYEKNIKIKRLIEKSNIPKEYRCGLKGWKVIPGTEAAYNGARFYIEDIKNNIEHGNSILFVGQSGTGKTRLSCAVGLALINEMVKVKCISLSKFLIEIESYRGRRDMSDRLDYYINYPALILDDIGESKLTDHYYKYIFSLIDGRNTARKITIMNTMKTSQELITLIGEHNVSRMLGMASGSVYVITSQKDMRLNNEK